ncbi:NADP-dependent oxidoreductase [Phaeobacter sp. HF9A]|uniref:NADP-dependent oxidoreductase n=1 Tax=Phaeobacter sp. HF9A TaxID=2721561 RepID=UPI00142FCFAA|nr:NADP-dependent oxidoreductase [Phaeobacter sp. HF9A]NIZ15331.1 NADP-dependent oxidoreductase [Phaeobacter sp. HF9A]
MSEQMHRILLASRPEGAPSLENFRHDSCPMPDPGTDEVLVKAEYMSLDPYMRGRMSPSESYVPPIEVGAPMQGGAVGEVLRSNHADFAPGDKVYGMFGWASHGCLPGSELQKLAPALQPSSLALGALGMPGFTGWHGLHAYGRPKAGETLVVGAATGPVGSMVGQLAKAAGLRVVGVAGGAEKCALAVESFGFDACLDHRAYAQVDALKAALSEVCPKGIDIYFENLGGKLLEAVLPLMNPMGRIPLCGMIAWYDGSPVSGLSAPDLWRAMLVKQLSVTGFIIANHFDQYPAFLEEVGPMLASGKIRFLEDVAEGLENAPAAFLSMLKGGNTGKQLVKLT